MIWGLPALLWYNLLLALRHPRRYRRCIKLMLPRFKLAPKKHTWLKHMLQGGYIVQKTVIGQGVDLGHLHGHFAHTPTTVTMCAACLADVPFSFTAHAKDIYTQDPRRIRDKVELRQVRGHLHPLQRQKYLARTSWPATTTPSTACTTASTWTFSRLNGRPPEAEAALPHPYRGPIRGEKRAWTPCCEALAPNCAPRDIDFRYTLVGEGKAKFNMRPSKICVHIDELGLDGRHRP